MTILLHCLQKEFSQEEYSSTLMFLHNSDSHIFLIMEMKGGGKCGFQTWRAVSVHSKRFFLRESIEFNSHRKAKKSFCTFINNQDRAAIMGEFIHSSINTDKVSFFM